MSEVLINLVTHSAYKDVCMDFLKLYRNNWKDCPFDFVISVVGEKIEFEGFHTVYHGKTCQLPEAVYNVMHNSKYEYCISFLGDAFINKKVDNNDISNLLIEIKNNGIQYCCLVPRRPFRLIGKKAGSIIRYISSFDVYNMCFVAFIASRNFIEKEFAGQISDLEFESEYLRINGDKRFYYKDRVIVTSNILNLVPGIDAGKWNRHAYKKLHNDNPDIHFNSRGVASLTTTVKNDLIHVLQLFISKKQRRIIKKVMSKIYKMKFMTDY
jgi:hypothetical protein ELI_1804